MSDRERALSLPGRVASASANASKYTEELGKFERRARELVEAKLRAETVRLVAVYTLAARSEPGAFCQGARLGRIVRIASVARP